jgi:hypothetical protein
VGALLGIEQISLKFANRQGVLTDGPFFQENNDFALIALMAFQKSAFYRSAGVGG